MRPESLKMSFMEIKKFTPMNKGSLLGFANVLITKWNFFINDISVFQKEGRRWISFPSRPYEVDGEKKYFPNVGFETREFKDAFQEKFLEALDAWMLANKKEEQQQNREQNEFELPF